MNSQQAYTRTVGWQFMTFNCKTFFLVVNVADLFQDSPRIRFKTVLGRRVDFFKDVSMLLEYM